MSADAQWLDDVLSGKIDPQSTDEEPAASDDDGAGDEDKDAQAGNAAGQSQPQDEQAQQGKDVLAGAEADAERPAPIASKSGTYTIPYEELTRARAQRDEARQALAALQAQVDAQRAAPASATQAPDGAQAAQNGQDLSGLFQDFTEEGIARGVQQAIERAQAPLLERIEQLQSQQQAQAGTAQQQAQQAHMQQILAAHADALEVPESREFRQWVDAQPVFARAGIERVLDAGTAQEVIELLSVFKQAAAPGQQVAGAESAKQEQPRTVVAPAPQPPVSLSDVGGASAAASDEARLAQMAANPAQSVDFLMQLDSAKLDQLLNRI